jgi:trigger factor
MQTIVETLEESKVRITVSVPETEFDKAIDAAFKKIALEVRLPGFRPGKAPRKLLEARLGTEVARQQAFKDGLPEFYAQAVIENDVDVIGFPEIAITAGEEDGDVEFTAVVEVRPMITLLGYDSMRVELPFAPVDDAAVDRQIDTLRSRSAELVESSRPLAEDDYATIDIVGSAPNDDGDVEEVDGLVAKEFLYRVGSANVVPELDEQLRGTKPGDTIEFSAALPERFGDRAGMAVQFRVDVTGAQEQKLPELTDEWASENSEFDTVDELRTNLRERLELMGKLQAQMAVRDKVIEAAAALVPIPPPQSLVNQEAQRRLQDLQQRLAQQGVGVEQYLAMTGTEPQEFFDQLREGAGGAVLADLAIRAVVVQEQISAAESEVDAEVVRLAEEAGQKPDKARKNLEKNGFIEAIRTDIARGKALQFLVDHTQVVDENGELLDLTLPEPVAAATVPEAESDQATPHIAAEAASSEQES